MEEVDSMKKEYGDFYTAKKKHFDKYILPLAAEFMDAMKELKYNKVRVRSYKSSVCAHFDPVHKTVLVDVSSKKTSGFITTENFEHGMRHPLKSTPEPVGEIELKHTGGHIFANKDLLADWL